MMAIKFDEPFALWIKDGISTLIVTPENIDLGKYALAGEKLFGEIEIKTSRQITIEEFQNLRDSHRISEEAREKYSEKNATWKNGPLFAFEFVFTPFETPVDYTVDSKEITFKIAKADDPDELMKPKGPWGEGFKECEAWVKRNRPKIKNPRGYCGAIYQRQQGKSAFDGIPTLIERPMAYDVILNAFEDGSELSVSKVSGFDVVMMTKTERLDPDASDTFIASTIHKISFPKDVCPCKLAKYDFKPLAEFRTGFAVFATIEKTVDEKITELRTRIKDLSDQLHALWSEPQPIREDSRTKTLEEELSYMRTQLEAYLQAKALAEALREGISE